MTSFEAKILVPFKLTEKYRQPIQTMHIFSQLDHCILIFTSSSITQPILIDLLQVSHFTGSQSKATSLIFGLIFGKRLRRVQIKVYFIENFLFQPRVRLHCNVLGCATMYVHSSDLKISLQPWEIFGHLGCTTKYIHCAVYG